MSVGYHVSLTSAGGQFASTSVHATSHELSHRVYSTPNSDQSSNGVHKQRRTTATRWRTTQALEPMMMMMMMVMVVVVVVVVVMFDGVA